MPGLHKRSKSVDGRPFHGRRTCDSLKEPVIAILSLPLPLPLSLWAGRALPRRHVQEESGYDALDTTMTFDQDDVGFLADADHPLLQGQEANAVGRYKRVYRKHRVIRKVRRSRLFGSGIGIGTTRME